MAKRHLCPDCLSSFKKRNRDWKRIKAESGWPDRLYHHGDQRKCTKHHVQSIADGAARRAGLKQATPAWVDRKAIKAVYEDAHRLTQETGIRYEVDHIIPLKGEAVRGLHVPWNLRVIPRGENAKKSNKIIPGL